jgi:predicted nucleic acid-binding protein
MDFNSLLIDTSFLVSFFFDQDVNYPFAQKMKDHLAEYTEVFITNQIYAETATVLSQRIGKAGLRKALENIEKMRISEIYIPEFLYTKAKRIYTTISEKDTSFVDLCTALAAERYGINSILSFDEHFSKMAKEYNYKLVNPKI